MKPLVKPKKSLKIALSVNDIVKNVKTQFEGTDLNQIKYNPDLINYICEQVENLIKNKLKKIDKKVVVFEILTKLLSLNEIDKKHIDGIIEHLHSCDLIKKIGFLKKLFLKLKNLI